MIELGKEVIDIVTGLKGTTVQRLEYLNGCVQYGIQQKVDNKKNLTEIAIFYIDEGQLKVVGTKKKKVIKKKTGGPTRTKVSDGRR